MNKIVYIPGTGFTSIEVTSPIWITSSELSDICTEVGANIVQVMDDLCDLGIQVIPFA